MALLRRTGGCGGFLLSTSHAVPLADARRRAGSGRAAATGIACVAASYVNEMVAAGVAGAAEDADNVLRVLGDWLHTADALCAIPARVRRAHSSGTGGGSKWSHGACESWFASKWGGHTFMRREGGAGGGVAGAASGLRSQSERRMAALEAMVLFKLHHSGPAAALRWLGAQWQLVRRSSRPCDLRRDLRRDLDHRLSEPGLPPSSEVLLTVLRSLLLVATRRVNERAGDTCAHRRAQSSEEASNILCAVLDGRARLKRGLLPLLQSDLLRSVVQCTGSGAGGTRVSLWRLKHLVRARSVALLVLTAQWRLQWSHASRKPQQQRRQSVRSHTRRRNGNLVASDWPFLALLDQLAADPHLEIAM